MAKENKNKNLFIGSKREPNIKMERPIELNSLNINSS
jgi:hypothetical protein